MKAELQSLQRQAVQLESEIDNYRGWMRALCLQSDPLVDVVVCLLDRFFGISLTVDDKGIEDATWRNAAGGILAVVEIKGVKGNFTRTNVGQIDAHRERLELAPETPGILVMNTMMGAASLQKKDQAPHPDIIKKAVSEHVILLRTLDLLRLADVVEAGSLDREQFQRVLLNASGWLTWKDGCLMILGE